MATFDAKWALPGIGAADIDPTHPIVLETEPTLYLDYLSEFAGTYRRGMSRLRGHVMAGAVGEALVMAHALRHTSGMIGVVGVEKLAAGLEDALRAGDDEVEVLLRAGEIEQRLESICKAVGGHKTAG